MSDTAEYWWDVKATKAWYGTTFYHIPNAPCGHRHLHEAKKLGNVNCYSCLELIKNGYDHGLSEGVYLTKSQRKRKTAENKEKQFDEKHGLCPCGSRWQIRKNKSNGQEFLGCINYPTCKNTKSINKPSDAEN
jgi:hypothetical protein